MERLKVFESMVPVTQAKVDQMVWIVQAPGGIPVG